MDKALMAAFIILAMAAPARANPPAATAGLLLAAIAIPILIFLLSYVSGGRAILRAAQVKTMPLWVWALVLFGTLFFGPMALLVVALAGLGRADRLVRWGFLARRPPSERASLLAQAEPRRLLAGGAALGLLTLALTGFGLYDWVENSSFGLLRRYSNEGATKGNLGAIRSALSIYYGDLEGQYPRDLSDLTAAGKYLASLPRAKTPKYHPDSSAVQSLTSADAQLGRFSDAGGWAYVVSGSSAGTVLVNCTHTDSRGNSWTSY